MTERYSEKPLFDVHVNDEDVGSDLIDEYAEEVPVINHKSWKELKKHSKKKISYKAKCTSKSLVDYGFTKPV